MLHHPGNAKIVVQQFNRVVNFDLLRLGKNIVDQHIVRPLKRPTRQVVKQPTQLFKTLQINPVNNLQSSRGRKLHDHRGHTHHMRQLRQYIPNLHRQRRPRNPDHHRRSRRHHDHIRPHARLPCSRVVQNPQRQSHDQQNQSHFQRDGNNTNQRPQRPVCQVCDNHLIHHDSQLRTRNQEPGTDLLLPRLSRVPSFIQSNHLGPGRLLQEKFVVGQRLV